MTKIITAADVLPLLKDIADAKQEHFLVIALDSGRRLLEVRTVFIGTVDMVPAHPREVFAHAIAAFASSIIVAHCHPSGDPSPSRQDISATQQLAAAAQILGIGLADHVIIAGKRHYSFAANGMILTPKIKQ